MYPFPYARSLSTDDEEAFLERNDLRFRTRLEAERVKKARMPNRLGREMLRREDEVDDDADVLESARDRSEDCDAMWAGVATAAAAAAAASCSLECRRPARRRRELSGLRRRGSRIMTSRSK